MQDYVYCIYYYTLYWTHSIHVHVFVRIYVLYLIICCIQLKYYNKKGHPLRVEDTYIWRVLQGLSTETVYLHYSMNAEGMHYSSWEVSRDSLRFFVESNATDHQEVSSFFFREKNQSLVNFKPATWSLESCHLTTLAPRPIYFIIIICIIYSCPKCSIRKIGHPQRLVIIT